jgi:hypothetical protein
VSWEALGAIGELLGAVLLVGSLVYVGVQIRDTKRQMMAASSQSRADGILELFGARLSPGFAAADVKARTDPDSLTPEERHMLLTFLMMYSNFMQNIHYQHSIGTLDADQVGALDSLPLLVASKFNVTVWKTILRESKALSPEFVAHVDRVIEARGA